jgi:bacillithiol biosynthesis cysteine-adding enzyme BshC
MGCTCIPYTRVPKSSALLTDYLYHFDRVSHFYSGAPFEPASHQSVAGKIAISDDSRRQLASVLTRQNQSFGSGEPTFENIRLLGEPGTVAVVTGQQVGLLTGPVFTLYKALTAVRMARSLNDQGRRAVPVFWLATEDHDLEEVAQAAVFDDEYSLVALRDAGVRPAERSSVGVVQLSAEIIPTLEKLEALLPAGDPRERLMIDLRECYVPGATWGQAFGRFMAKLFSRWGVILLDPLDVEIHKLAKPVYEHALTHAQDLRRRLLERWAELVRSGHHAQVHVTDDSTLLFLTREGSRLPIHQRNGQYLVDDADSISLAELQATAEQNPLDLSPNVLLRPVVQDSLLPTVAYVAGPSELAYFGQAQVLYKAMDRPMPVILPRAAFTLVDRRVHRLMEKYQVTIEDVWQGRDHLSRKIAAAGFSEGGAQGWSERFDQSESELAVLFERLRREIEALDSTLVDSLKHAEERMKYQMEKLRGKISRAALQKSELLARHEESLLRFLAPHKDLQEREVSGVYFLGRAGYELLDRLLDETRTNTSDHQILVY